MKHFDEKIKKQAKSEMFVIPEQIDHRIEQILDELPETVSNASPSTYTLLRQRGWALAAAAAIFALIIMPNVSITYAKTLEQLPVIGEFVHIITIRNHYEDNTHELDINKPNIITKDGESEQISVNQNINQNINELTNRLINQFYDDLDENGSQSHNSIELTYDIITNTPNWFTLKLSVTQIAGSSDTYYKFYHIDRQTDQIVYLNDLFKDARYKDVISKEIQRQMKQQMQSNPSISYWFDQPEENTFSDSFTSINERQHFYWNETGDLVIAFDKYEVGPGSIGTPEFKIPRTLLSDLLKDTYK